MTVELQNWGLVDYDAAIARQDAAHARRLRGEIPDSIFVLEHPPVITRGRKMADLQLPHQSQLEDLGVMIRNADRGGELTYHGPGQIVVYFVLELKNRFLGVTDLVMQIQNVLLDFASDLGINATLHADHPGLWVATKKIASVGLRVESGITKHGIAFNVQNDLTVYRYFSPCGLSGDVMTTLSQIKGRTYSRSEFLQFQEDLLARFGARLESLASSAKTAILADK